MWEYYVITELRIIYQDIYKKVHTKNIFIHKETKHFIGYNGDFDSDESGYEDDRDLFYRNQLKRYDKTILLYSDGNFIKEEYNKKYRKWIENIIDNDNEIIVVSKTKFTQLKI